MAFKVLYLVRNSDSHVREVRRGDDEAPPVDGEWSGVGSTHTLYTQDVLGLHPGDYLVDGVVQYKVEGNALVKLSQLELDALRLIDRLAAHRNIRMQQIIKHQQNIAAADAVIADTESFTQDQRDEALACKTSCQAAIDAHISAWDDLIPVDLLP